MFTRQPLGGVHWGCPVGVSGCPHWSTTGGPPTSVNGHQWSPYQTILTLPLYHTMVTDGLHTSAHFNSPPLGPPGSLGALRVDSIRKYEGCIPRFRIQLFGTETVYFDALQQTMASINCCVDRLMQPRIPEAASSNLKLADIFSFLHHGDGDGRWWLTLR